MNLYIIGPVVGIENGNAEAFDKAELELSNAGYSVDMPKNHHFKNPGSVSYMLQSARLMLYNDGVALLPGWEHDQDTLKLRGICLDIGYPHIKTVAEWIETALSKTDGQ